MGTGPILVQHRLRTGENDFGALKRGFLDSAGTSSSCWAATPNPTSIDIFVFMMILTSSSGMCSKVLAHSMALDNKFLVMLG